MKKQRNILTAIILIMGIITISGKTQAQEIGKTYAFEVNVSGSGEPIILIPGLISSGDVWSELVQELSADYECHVITFAGYAGVDPISEDPYLPRWKTDLIKYIEEQRLENVSLIGHSLGGFMSMWIGTENHPKIKQMVIVDAMPFFALMMNPNAQTGFDESAAQTYMQSFQNLDDEQHRNARMMTARGMVRDSTKYELLTEWAIHSDLKTEAYSAMEMMGMDLREDIAGIQVPMLVLAAFAENATYPQFTKESVKETYKSQYEHAKTVELEIVEEAGHFIMFDQPRETYRLIKEFLSNEF